MKGNILDVGIDVHPNFEPWSLEEIFTFIKKREEE